MYSQIFTSNLDHPTISYILKQPIGNVNITTNLENLRGGTALFLVGASAIIPEEIRSRYNYCFVIHGSNLPKGRGWSPVNWEIEAGVEIIHLTLLTAADRVDEDFDIELCH